MKKNTHYTETSQRLTLRQIREKVGSTKGKALPTAKALRDTAEMVDSCRTDDSILEVYSNGFAVYQKPCHQAVLRMEYVGRAKYEEYDADGDFVKVHSYDLEDEDWSIAVMVTGEERMEKRYEEKSERTTVSTTGTGYREDEDLEPDDMEIDAGVDVQQEVIDANVNEAAETVQKLLTGLTERQRTVVEMYYIKGMTQQEIADVLGISKQSVSECLSWAMKKLQKNSRKI